MDLQKILKAIMVLLMVLGIALSVFNIFSTDGMAIIPGEGINNNQPSGTLQPDGCYGEPLNC